jgi:hypothetical protein
MFAKVTSMPGVSKLTPLIAAALCLCAAPAAHAAEPGLTVDPQSPSGTEYAIPLDQARSSAGHLSDSPGAGVRSSGGGPSSAAPLFGVGVSAGGSGGSGVSGGGSAGSGGSTGAGGAPAGPGKHHSSGGGAEGGTNSPSILPTVLSQAAASPTAGANSSLLVGGIAAGTLLAGGGA